MRIPEPTPKRSQGKDPKRPSRRGSALDRIVAADAKARRGAGDLIVRLDVPAPSDKALKRMGADPADRKLVSHAEAQREGLAERIVTDHAFAAELADSPAETLAQAGVPEASGHPAPSGGLAGRATVAGVRFEVPDVVRPDLEWVAEERADEAAQALVAATMTAATATDAKWRAIRTDPDPTVRSAANALDWPTFGIAAGSATAAAVTIQVIDSFRATFGLPAATTAPPGPAQPGGVTPATAAAVFGFDPDVAARGVRTVRVPTRGL